MFIYLKFEKYTLILHEGAIILRIGAKHNCFLQANFFS